MPHRCGRFLVWWCVLWFEIVHVEHWSWSETSAAERSTKRWWDGTDMWSKTQRKDRKYESFEQKWYLLLWKCSSSFSKTILQQEMSGFLFDGCWIESIFELRGWSFGSSPGRGQQFREVVCEVRSLLDHVCTLVMEPGGGGRGPSGHHWCLTDLWQSLISDYTLSYSNI